MKKCGLPKTKEIKEIFESTDYRDISTDSYTIAIAVDAFKKFTNTEKNLEKLHSAFNKLVNAKSNRAEYMIPLLYSAAYNNGYSWGDVNTLATKIYKNINSPDKMAQSKWYKLCIDSAKEATYISPSQWKSLLSKVETRDEKLKTNPERRPTK